MKALFTLYFLTWTAGATKVNCDDDDDENVIKLLLQPM